MRCVASIIAAGCTHDGRRLLIVGELILTEGESVRADHLTVLLLHTVDLRETADAALLIRAKHALLILYEKRHLQ